jgi:hypothetical protein
MNRTYVGGGLAIAVLLVGCEPSELHPVPVFGGGSSGGSYSAPAARPLPAAPPNQQMLQDPEGNLEDNGIEVVADNDTQARNQCEDIAASRSDPWTIVTCQGCRLRTKTTGKYICTLRTEIVPLPPGETP